MMRMMTMMMRLMENKNKIASVNGPDCFVMYLCVWVGVGRRKEVLATATQPSIIYLSVYLIAVLHTSSQAVGMMLNPITFTSEAHPTAVCVWVACNGVSFTTSLQDVATPRQRQMQVFLVLFIPRYRHKVLR